MLAVKTTASCVASRFLNKHLYMNLLPFHNGTHTVTHMWRSRKL